jgi:hypothetical protein
MRTLKFMGNIPKQLTPEIGICWSTIISANSSKLCKGFQEMQEKLPFYW